MLTKDVVSILKSEGFKRELEYDDTMISEVMTLPNDDYYCIRKEGLKWKFFLIVNENKHNESFNRFL